MNTNYTDKKKNTIEWNESTDHANQKILKGTFSCNGKKYEVIVTYTENLKDAERLIKTGLEKVDRETMVSLVGQKVLCSNFNNNEWSLEGNERNLPLVHKETLSKNITSIKNAFQSALNELFKDKIESSSFNPSISIKEQPQVKPGQTPKKSPRKKTDKRIFAQLHAAHLISKTKFEGGIDYENTDAMRNVVDSLCPNLSGEDKKIMEETSQFLKSKYEMEKGIASYFSSAGSIYSKICSQLDKGESVYISGGWADLKSHGHCAAIKFYKKGDEVCFYIINRGAGSEYHSVLKDVSGGKEKRDIRSDIYTMPLNQFKGEKGKELIQALHELQHPERTVSWISRAWAHIKDFFTGYSQGYFRKLFETRLKVDQQDAYGVCEFFKNNISNKDPDTSQKYASTSQIAGNCTQASLNASLLDYLIDKGFSREQINRLMFLIKQQSLENAYEDWKNDPDPEMKILLRDAAKQHLIRVAKNQSLSEEEKASAWDLANTILENIPEEQSSQIEIPSNVACNETKPLSTKTTLSTIFPEGNKKILLRGQPAVSEIAKLEAPKTLNDVPKFLKQALELAKDVEKNKGDIQKLFIDLAGIVDRLPSDGKSFWGSNNKQKCQEVLEQIDAIGAFLKALHGKIKKGQEFEDQSQLEQTMAILYEISIHTAEQIFPTLKNYRIALPPVFKNLDEMSLSKRKRMLKIQENLAQRDKNILEEEQQRTKETKDVPVLFKSGSFSAGRCPEKPFRFPEENFLNDLKPEYETKIREIHKKGGIGTYRICCRAWLNLHRELLKKNKDYLRLLSSIVRGIKPDEDANPSEYFDHHYDNIKFLNSRPQKRPELLNPNETEFSLGSENIILSDSLNSEPKVVIPGVSNQKLMELTQIMMGAETAPMKIMVWLGDKSNLKLMAHHRIRRAVEKCLFSLGNLENISKEYTELFLRHFDHFQKTLQNAFDANSFIDERTLEAYLSALRINEAVKEIAECKSNVDTKKEMEKLLLSDLPLSQKQLVASAYLSRFLDSSSIDGSEKTFLLAFFIYKTSLRSHDALSLRAENAINLHHKKAWEWALKNPSVANLILNKEGQKASIQDDTIECNGFKLHSTGVIESSQKNNEPLPYFVMQSPLYKEYFGIQQPVPFKQENGFLREIDGNHRLLIKEDGAGLSGIDKLFNIKEQSVWARYQSKEDLEELLKKTSLSPLFFKSPNKTFLEVGSSSPRIFIVDGFGELIYTVLPGEGRIYDVEEKEITSLSALKDENWNTFCGRLDDSKYVNIGVQNNQMHSLEFVRLGLSFDRKHKNWESKQYPGFFIAKPQETPLHSFKGGLVIQNKKGEKKLLMPFHPFEDRLEKNKSLLKQKEEELNRPESKNAKKVLEEEIKLLKKEIKSCKKETNRCFETSIKWEQDTPDSTIPCFVYDKKGEQWKSENPQASLYMSLLFRSEKNYIKAKEQLDRASSPLGLSKLDLLIEKELWKKEDLSPEGVAFDLHFYLRIQTQDKKLTKDTKLDRNQRKELKKLKKENAESRQKHLENLQMRYRNLQSDRVEYINQIPEALRLNNEQKKDLGGLEGYGDSGQVDVLANYSYLSRLSENELTQQIEKLNVSFLNPLWEETKEESVLESLAKNTILKVVLNKMISHAPHFDPNKIHPVMGKSDKKNSDPNIPIIPPIHAYLIKNFDAILKAAANEKTREKTFRHLQFLGRYFEKEGTSGKELHLLLSLACCISQTNLATVLKEKTSKKKAEKLISLIQTNGNKDLLYKDPQNPFSAKRPERLETEKFEIKAKQEIVENKITNLSVPKTQIDEKSVVAPMGEFYVASNFSSKLVPNKVLPNDAPKELFTSNQLDQETDPQVKKKMKELNGAYQKVKNTQSLAYSSDTALNEMESKITEHFSQATNEVKSKRALALQKANAMHLGENINKRTGQQLKEITETDLKAAYLRQDYGSLLSQNPELEEKKAKKIFQLMMKADLAEYKVKQCEEMLQIIRSEIIDENEKKQRLAEVSLRQFDPEILQKYPQLSVYVAATGLWPRQDQIDAINWAVKSLEEGKQLTKAQARMLERSAGFGKTKVFTVIVAQIMASRGLLTTVVNIASLYDFGKKDLSDSLREAFMQNIELIEWGLGNQEKINLENLKALAEKMDQWKQLGHVVYIKPETWHVINIAKKQAIKNENKDLQKAAEAVLDKIGKGLVLADEGHLVFSPLTEVNRAGGEKKTLSKELVEDLFENYAFLGKEGDLFLKQNQQSGIDEKTIQRVQQELIKDICEREPFKTYSNMSEWLKQPMNAEPPQWLNSILKNNEALFNRIEVQHRFVQGLMQSMMKKRGKIDVGIHSNPKIDYAVPRRDKEETGASYSDAIITLASTIQVMMQEGVQRDTFQNFLEKQLDMHRKELDESFTEHSEPTSIEKKFEDMLEKPISLDGLLPGSKAEEHLYDQLKSNEKFLKWIIEEQITPQIIEYTEKYTSTPAEFLNGCQHAIVFTATAGSLDTYPTTFVEDKEQHQLDLEAQAIDLAHMLSKKNSKVVLVDSFQTEKEFFEQLSKLGVECENVQFVIDRGGLFRNTKDNQDIVNGMNEILKNKKPGIIVKEVLGERQAYFVDNNIPPKITPLEGSNLEKAMKLAKLDPKKLGDAVHIFTIDLCTGTDWTLPDKCDGIFTIGENTTLSGGIQAGKRDRKMRSENHKFTWVAPKNIKEKIKPEGNLTPSDIVYWMVQNQVKEETQLIASSFDQGVDALLVKCFPEKTASIKVLQNPSNKVTQQEFLRKYTHNPLLGQIVWKLHMLGVVNIEKNEVIQNVADINDYLINKESAFTGPDIAELNRLIERTKNAKITDFSTIEKEEQREMEVEEQREKDEQKEQVQVIKQAYKTSPKKETYEDYFHSLKSLSKDMSLPEIKKHFDNPMQDYWPKSLKGPTLHLSATFLFFTKEDVPGIRPCDQMLVMCDENGENYMFFPISARGLNYYHQQLKTEVPGKKFAIVDLRGKVIFSQMDTKHNSELEESKDLKQACTLLSLSRGEIRGSKETLKEVFGGLSEEEFGLLEKNVKERLVGPGAKFEQTRYNQLKDQMLKKN